MSTGATKPRRRPVASAPRRQRRPSLAAAIKAARKAGESVTEAVVEPDGTVRLRLGGPNADGQPNNDWDTVLHGKN